MNNEPNRTINIKFAGELTIQKSDLKNFLARNMAPTVVQAQAENPKQVAIQTTDGLPRLAFTIKETADMLGVAPQTIYRFIRRGLLKSSFASRKIIISKVEIERFLKETSRSQYER
jgi:excisionase family DNA binding protein